MKEHTPQSSNPITFRTTFSREYKQVVNIIDKNVTILRQDITVSVIFDQGYQCVAKKAPSLNMKIQGMLLMSRKVLSEKFRLGQEGTSKTLAGSRKLYIT